MPTAPPTLSTPVASNECHKYTDGEGFNAICAPLFEIISTLIYQANDINTQAIRTNRVSIRAVPLLKLSWYRTPS